MDWNDLRLFLAVAQHGSIRAAGEHLGVNQSTVNRRMDVLEHDLKLRLFDRSTRGLALNAAGRAIADAAAPLSGLVTNVLQGADAQRRALTGSIKITAPSTAAIAFVAPIVEIFRAKFPDIRVEYDGSEARLDLHKGEADVALRAGPKPPDDSLHADLIHDHEWALYCSTGYAAQHGVPTCLAELRQFDVVDLAGAIGTRAGHQWMMQFADPARIAGTAQSVPNMRDILYAGLGVGTLPIMTGNRELGLVRCFDPIPELNTQMWLVTTHEARRVPRIAAFVEVALQWYRDGHGQAALLPR